MKKKKLKPILTGSVLVLPTVLLLGSGGQEAKSMMRGAANKIMSNMSSLSGIKNLKFKPPSGMKAPTLNVSKLPSVKNNVTLNTSKSNSLPRISSTGTDKPTLKKSSSGIGTNFVTRRTPPARPPAPNFNSPLNTKKKAPALPQRDPGYNTVPKPIFTPRDPNKGIPETENYQNVVQMHTPGGTLTIFKDN